MTYGSARSRDENLSDHHFDKLATYIETNVGIRLPQAKRVMVEGRLRKRAKALGLDNLSEYGFLIFDQGAFENELPHLIDCMTTNKTDFFREPSHFEALCSDLLPSLLRSPSQSQHLKFWSAACSIGAEAFTIAMVLDDYLAGRPRTTFSILATDICTDVLRDGRRAIYHADMLTPVPEAMLRRYVMQSRDPARKEARIVPELRKVVRFEYLNLMDEKYPFDRDMDVIFCRNVLIYFERAVQDRVVQRLTSHLRPGGYLILGHSESMAGSAQSQISQVMPTIYQRAGGKLEKRQWPTKQRA